jgi:hypothetical protein
MSEYQWHHLNPTAVFRATYEFANQIIGNNNSLDNLVRLPTTTARSQAEGAAVHLGPHNVFSNAWQLVLEDIQRDSKGNLKLAKELFYEGIEFNRRQLTTTTILQNGKEVPKMLLSRAQSQEVGITLERIFHPDNYNLSTILSGKSPVALADVEAKTILKDLSGFVVKSVLTGVVFGAITDILFSPTEANASEGDVIDRINQNDPNYRAMRREELFDPKTNVALFPHYSGRGKAVFIDSYRVNPDFRYSGDSLFLFDGPYTGFITPAERGPGPGVRLPGIAVSNTTRPASEGAQIAQREAVMRAAEKKLAVTHEARDERSDSLARLDSLAKAKDRDSLPDAAQQAAVRRTEQLAQQTRQVQQTQQDRSANAMTTTVGNAHDRREIELEKKKTPQVVNPTSLVREVQAKNKTPTPATPNPGDRASGGWGNGDSGGNSGSGGYSGRIPTPTQAPSRPSTSNSGSSSKSSGSGSYAGQDRNPSSSSSSGSGNKGNNGMRGHNPVILDLAGTGLAIDELSSSSMYYDMNDDGQMHRTAWAAKGEGVLAIDANGDGKISGRNEIIFTDWDASADSDLAAIKSAFDSNKNGMLDAGDARFGDFRVMVDGQTKTLTEAGIVSIDLTPKGSGETFDDGSRIAATTIFTRTDGTTGKVGDATLVADTDGATLKTTTSVVNGASVVDKKTYDVSGALTGEIEVTTSADGNTRTTRFDEDGDGVFDRKEVQTTTIASGAITVETVATSREGQITSKDTRLTSADRRKVTNTHDDDGNGIADRIDVLSTYSSGIQNTLKTVQNADGSLKSRTKIVASADGLQVTTSENLLGRTVDGLAGGADIWDRVTKDFTTVDANANRTRTVTVSANNGKVLSTDVITSSADGRSRTDAIDVDGDHNDDTIETDALVINADGSSVLTSTTRSRSAALLSSEVTTTTANGLSKTTQSDLYGLGRVERTRTDVTVLNADGTRTETITDKHNDASLASRSVTTTTSAGQVISRAIDTDGDGKNDKTVTTTVSSTDGSVTTVTKVYSADGSKRISSDTDIASSDGRATTTLHDYDGDGTVDLVEKHTTEVANGITTERDWQESRTTDAQPVAFKHHGKVTTTSADGLTVTTSLDRDYNGTADTVTTDKITVNNGVRTQTVTERVRNNTFKPTTTTTLSADRLTTTVVVDDNGDTKKDTDIITVIGTDGRKTVTATNYAANAAIIAYSTAETSMDGLTIVTKTDSVTSNDLNGTKSYEFIATDKTVLNDDGSRTRTVTTTTDNGSFVDQTVQKVSGNGLNIVTQIDLDGLKDTSGNIAFETMETSNTSLWSDGSRNTTVTVTNADLTTRSTIYKKTSANGLVVATEDDSFGYGWYQSRTEDTTTLDTAGRSTQVIKTLNNDKTVRSLETTTVEANGLKKTIATDFDADGKTDTLETIQTQADGTVVDTVQKLTDAGAIISSVSRETLASGLKTYTRSDVNGDNLWDTVEERSRTYEDVGTTTDRVKVNSLNGKLISYTALVSYVQTDQTTLYEDMDGAGDYERRTTKKRYYNSDGSIVDSAEVFSLNSTLLNKAVSTISSDSLTKTETSDDNGDGKLDEIAITTKLSDGSVTKTTEQRSYSGIADTTGTVFERVSSLTSADGLVTFTQYDQNADSTFENYDISKRSVGADGTQKQTVEHRAQSSNPLTVDGKLLSQTVTTTGATGLWTTKSTDSDGNGTADTFEKTTIEFDAAGGRSVTNSIWSGGSETAALQKRTNLWTSANGLSSDIKTDDYGLGWYQSIVQDRSDVSKSGVKTQIVTTFNALDTNNTVSSQQTVVSSNGRTVTKTQDIDGNTTTDRTDTTTLNLDGSTAETQKTFNAAGAVAWQKVSTVSANGLVKNSQIDADGNDAFETVLDDITTINADGTTTQTESRKVNGVLKEQVQTISQQNGFYTKRLVDAKGTNTFNQMVTDQTAFVTIAGGDYAVGSSIRTVETKNGNDAASALVKYFEYITSADKRTTVVNADLDGNGKKDFSDVLQMKLDRSSVRTLTDYDVDGVTAKNVKTITTSADGLTVAAAWTLNDKTASGRSRQQVTVLGSSGDRTTTDTTYSATNVVFDKSTTTVSGNGFVRTVDYTGPATLEVGNAVAVKQHSEVTTLSNGLKTVTLQDFDASGAQLNQSVASLTANGLSETLELYKGVSQTADQTSQKNVTANKNGTIDTLTVAKIGTVLLSTVTESKSANGLTTSTTEDLDGDGQNETVTTTALTKNDDGSSLKITNESYISNNKLGISTINSTTLVETDATGRFTKTTRDIGNDNFIDQTETYEKRLDGTTYKLVENRNINRSKADTTAITTSADGLVVNTVWDYDNDAVADRKRDDVTVQFQNGNSVETVKDFDKSSNLVQSIVTTVSNDGRNKHTEIDNDGVKTNGSYTVDHIEDTTVNIDGSSFTMAKDKNTAGTITAQTTTYVSSDGRTKTILKDADNNATFEYKEISYTNVDGSTSTEMYDLNTSNNAWQTAGRTFTTADGDVSWTQLDKNHDGTFEHWEKVQTNIDGSKTTTAIDYSATNSVLKSIVTDVSANGQTQIVKTNDNGKRQIAVSGNWFNMGFSEPGSQTVIFSGDNNKIQMSLNDSSVFILGKNNELNGGGVKNHVQSDGDYNTITLGLSGSEVFSKGTGNRVEISGASNYIESKGTLNRTYAFDNNDGHVFISGSENSLSGRGEHLYIDIDGDRTSMYLVISKASEVHSTGNNADIDMHSSNDGSIFISGSSNRLYGSGAKTYIEVNGNSNNLNLSINDSRVITSGSNNTTYSMCSYDSAGNEDYKAGQRNYYIMYGYHDNLRSSGRDNYIYLEGDYANFENDSVLRTHANDHYFVDGNYQTLTVDGIDHVIQVYGNNSQINTGNWAHNYSSIYVYGDNNSIFNWGGLRVAEDHGVGNSWRNS